MNGFRNKVVEQMEVAENLLWLHAEVEKKKRMQELLRSLNICESADYLTVQLNELHSQLKIAQEQFDQRMNEVISTFRTKSVK